MQQTRKTFGTRMAGGSLRNIGFQAAFRWRRYDLTRLKEGNVYGKMTLGPRDAIILGILTDLLKGGING